MSQVVTAARRPTGFFGGIRDALVILWDPKARTRQALTEIAFILKDAGWADPDPEDDVVPPDPVGRLRQTAGEHLRPDDLPLIQALVTDIRPLPEVAAALGRDPADLERAVADFRKFAAAAAGPVG